MILRRQRPRASTVAVCERIASCASEAKRHPHFPRARKEFRVPLNSHDERPVTHLNRFNQPIGTVCNRVEHGRHRAHSLMMHEIRSKAIVSKMRPSETHILTRDIGFFISRNLSKHSFRKRPKEPYSVIASPGLSGSEPVHTEIASCTRAGHSRIS